MSNDNATRWIVGYEGWFDEGGRFRGTLAVGASDEYQARKKAEDKLRKMCDALEGQYTVSYIHPERVSL